MSRVEELIDQMCSGGVLHERVDAVASLKRGKAITKKDVVDGLVPVVAGGRTPAYHHNESNRSGETVVVAGSGAYAGFVSYWDKPIYVSDAFSVDPLDVRLSARFLYYWLQSQQDLLHSFKSGGGVPHVYTRNVASMRIPVPPLEVQREIVRILDQFTQLEAELEAELEARRAQYDHYFRSLLSFGPGEASELTLGDIGRVAMCKRIFKHQTSESGEIPFFKIGTFGRDPDAYISRDLFESYRNEFSFPNRGDVLISAAGTIGRTVVYDGQLAYFQDSNIVWLKHDESVVSNAYLKHWYQVVEWATDGGTIKRLYNANVLRAKIMVPPRTEQDRIVATLDKFDSLVNDISIGLPAELAARRRQYEHYRDRLLTFKELDA